jgi:hypothetical protein
VKKNYLVQSVSFFIATIILLNSCSKGGGGGTPTNPCTGVTISVTGTTTNPSSPGASDGSINASAGSGFSYSLNGGAFQLTGLFNSLPAGSYSIVAKNSNGCTGAANFTLSANTCAGVNITVTAATTDNTPCQNTNNGSLTITVSGGVAPYTYSINGGAFQSSNIFSGLNGGVSYFIMAKDANGCTGSTTVTVNNTTAGPLFSAVKTLIQNNCALSGCHGDTQQPLFLIGQCVIVTNGPLINERAVIGTPSPMPPTGLLPASERQKITDWINAGGHFNN